MFVLFETQLKGNEMSRINTGGGALIAVLVASLSLTACSTANPETSDSPETVSVPGATDDANSYMNELYSEALDSGKTDIVIYSSSQSTQTDLADLFSERFPGMTIVPQDAADSVNHTKLQTEAQSGNRIADLYTGGAAAAAAAAALPDVCAPLEVKTAPREDLPYSSDDLILSYAYRYFTFVYNSDLVTAEEAPRTWDDLLDPKWEGKILSGDPTVLGATRYIFTGLLVPESEEKWGEPYLSQLAQQELNVASSEPNIPAEVASGRFPIGIGVYSGFYNAQKEKGAPIESAFPLEDGGNFITSAGICGIKDAPHAAAANLYVNWLFTQEGQEALAEVDDAFGTLPGSPGPDGIGSLEEIGALPMTQTDPAFNEPYFATIDSLFKKS